VLEAFRGLDFRVVVEQFLTDTAREADVVLPAKSLFEQTDVIGAYWHPYLQLRQKALEPPGEVKPETEVYRLLAARLGLPQDAVDAAIPGENEVEAWLEARLAPLGLDLAHLREGPVLAPGCEEVAFAERAFPTPSGKIELDSEEAARRWGVERLPDWSEPAEALGTGGTGERFPLHLLTPNTKNRIHSQFGNLAMIRELDPEPVIDVSPADALPRGLRGGERVRVFNDRGALEVRCRLDFGLRAGCVSLANGWWLSEGGAVNVLSAARETDLGHGAAFHENRVELEKVEG
jgi:anaerobic selenocysteine-containing dehydrogenase